MSSNTRVEVLIPRKRRSRDQVAKRRLTTAGRLAWLDDAEAKLLGDWLSCGPDREVSRLAGLIELEERSADASQTAMRPTSK